MHALWELSTVQSSFLSLSAREKEVHVRQAALGLTEERQQLCEELSPRLSSSPLCPQPFPSDKVKDNLTRI